MKNYIVIASLLLPCLFSCSDGNENQSPMNTNKVELLSPDGLHKNPAYSQLATIEGNFRTVYIGGQNPVDKNGNTIGKGDMEAQAKQVLQNLEIALEAGGASFENVIKWNVYLVQGKSVEKAFKVFQGSLSKLKKPPLVTGIFVAGLANPDFLLEVEAIAVVPPR